MSSLYRRQIIPNQFIGRTLEVEPTPPLIANGKLRLRASPMLIAEVDLTGIEILLTAANDWGTVKLLDLANRNFLIVAADLDAVFSVSGLASNVGTAVDFALGSASTITTTFDTAGESERYYLNKIDGTGAAATGNSVEGHSFANLISGTLNVGGLPVGLEAHPANNDLYLNVSSPVTSGTGAVTFTSGYARLYYLDCGITA